MDNITSSVYSRYWRKNRSGHESTELALTLRAMRKVSSHIGRNVKPIFWQGMAENSDSAIILDPNKVKGSYPISFKKIDLMVGQVTSEALAGIEWSDWVKKHVYDDFEKYTIKEIRPYLIAIIDAADQIYLSEIAKPDVWSLYFLKYLQKNLVQNTRDPLLPPSPSSLANEWIKIVVFNQQPAILHHYYEYPLNELIKQTDSIIQIKSLPTVGSRKEARINILSSLCHSIYQIIYGWEIFTINPDASFIQDESGPKVDLPPEEKNETIEEKNEQENEGLDSELSSEIKSILEEGDIDITEQVSSVLEDPEAGFMETIFMKGVAKADVLADEMQVKRLRKLFKQHEALIRRRKKRHFRKALTNGKLDAKRLYRTPIDGRIFKFRELPKDDFFWNLIIVADSSASMTGKGGLGRPWNFAEKAFGALSIASKGFKNSLAIYAYHEEKNRCILVELYHGGEIFTIAPGGRTPSGQAIVAAAIKSKKRYKNSLIIHITDGASNCGINLRQAVEYCKNIGVDVVNIGFECDKQTKDFLAQCFPPGQLYFMNDIKNLTLVLENVLGSKIIKKLN